MPLPTSSSPDPENRLVEEAQKGNSDAFAQIYDLYVERIYRFMALRVGDHHLAEDLTSEVFLKAWDKLWTYQSRGLPFSAWLFRIARNLVVDHYRNDRDMLSLDESIPGARQNGVHDITADLEKRQEAERIMAALNELTDDQRELLVLKFIQGMSTPEIARVMGKRQGALRALQMRGLQALAKKLGIKYE